jgi:hypothetical protein
MEPLQPPEIVSQISHWRREEHRNDRLRYRGYRSQSLFK